jgi:hypothetical protein
MGAYQCTLPDQGGVQQFWLLLHHSDGAQKNRDQNEQFNITYDQW